MNLAIIILIMVNSNSSQDVYLYNKGNVMIETFILQGERALETYQRYDIYDFEYKNTTYSYDTNLIFNNHIKINSEKCREGCRFLFKVSLDDSVNDNSNLFTLYRSTQNPEINMNVDLNTNIYGNIYDKSDNYYYKTNINENDSEIIITLNCLNCKMCIKNKAGNDTECLNIIRTNYIMKKKELENYKNGLYYFISGDQGYYYFSFSSPKSPKYIEQLESEPCYEDCTLIFPLHNYYNYSYSNSLNISQIIFFVPDYENITISYDYLDMSEFENDLINNSDISDKTDNIGNKLFLDLNVSDIKDKENNEKYLRIHIKSNENEKTKYLNVIMNKFINSPNIDNIKYTKNIVSMKENSQIKDNHDFQFYLKI